jgi:hypothetical protein
VESMGMRAGCSTLRKKNPPLRVPPRLARGRSNGPSSPSTGLRVRRAVAERRDPNDLGFQCPVGRALRVRLVAERQSWQHGIIVSMPRRAGAEGAPRRR